MYRVNCPYVRPAVQQRLRLVSNPCVGPTFAPFAVGATEAKWSGDGRACAKRRTDPIGGSGVESDPRSTVDRLLEPGGPEQLTTSSVRAADAVGTQPSDTTSARMSPPSMRCADGLS